MEHGAATTDRKTDIAEKTPLCYTLAGIWLKGNRVNMMEMVVNFVFDTKEYVMTLGAVENIWHLIQ